MVKFPIVVRFRFIWRDVDEQLVHRGATYASKVNRQQVADGVALLGDIVPLVLSLMLDAHTLDYGAIEYPVLPSA